MKTDIHSTRTLYHPSFAVVRAVVQSAATLFGACVRRSGVALTRLATILALLVAPAHASPGDPDLSFGPGVVITPIVKDGSAYAWAIAMDGNQMVVGGSCSGTTLPRHDVMCVARYLPDGRLDTAFGDAGKVLTPIGDSASYDSEVSSIAVQSDRKIVVTGLCRIGTGNLAFCTARYNVNGSLDTGFGAGGLVVTVFGGTVTDASAAALALQADGKVVVGGACESTVTASRDFCIVRYMANGTLDGTFGTGGKVLLPVGTGTSDDYLSALLIQQDGRLLAAGACNNAPQFCLVRFDAQGGVDNTFGTNGKLFVAMGDGIAGASSLAQQSDGKLLAAGNCRVNTVLHFCLARLTLSTGALDSSFGTGGKVIRAVTAGLQDFAYRVLLQPNSNIVISGSCRDLVEAGVTGFCSIRMQPNGQPDTSYGGDGVVTTFPRGSALVGSAAVLQVDGKIVQAGACAAGVGSSRQFCLVRYTTDGTLDLSFNGGGSGAVFTPLFGGGQAISSAVQADGKIILGGFCYNGSNNDFCLTRYLRNGVADTGFGIAGSIITPVGAGEDGGSAVLVQPDAKVILAGNCAVTAGNNDFCIARYLASGALDTSFGQSGKVITPIGTGNDAVNAALLQPDGRIVLAGYCVGPSGSYDFCLARYLPNGVFDVSFNGTGKLITDLSQNDDYATSIALQSDGKLVIAGVCMTGGSNDFCFARYLPTGQLDASFGGSGRLSYAMTPSDDVAWAAAVQPDGKIIAAGSCSGNYCAVRLLADGSLDLTFGSGGRVLIGAFLGSGDIAYALALLPDGKFVLGGSCRTNPNSQAVACLARFNADGSLDSTFGINGTSLGLASNNDVMRAISLLPDGKILQAGTCSHESKLEFCMVLYEGGPQNYRYCSLDIDGDGVVTSMTDTLIAMRVMRGVTGPGVIGGITFAPHAQRTTWGDNTERDIRRYLRTQCGMTIIQ